MPHVKAYSNHTYINLENLRSSCSSSDVGESAELCYPVILLGEGQYVSIHHKLWERLLILGYVGISPEEVGNSYISRIVVSSDLYRSYSIIIFGEGQYTCIIHVWLSTLLNDPVYATYNRMMQSRTSGIGEMEL